MGNFIQFEYKDVKDFSKEFGKRIGKRNVDDMFKDIANNALENTLTAVERPKELGGTPVQDGDLKRAWRKDVKSARKTKGEFVASAENKVKNKLAARFGMEQEYASWVEEGNKKPAPYYEDENGKVHWISRPEGVHMLVNAEDDTLNKLPKIVDDEIKKFFGGLFD